MRAPISFRSSRRGFTLVELMVAMTGGLFLSIVVFALSRDASRFYQREARMANATLAGVSGFVRLSGDLARAGHLVTPNITSDPHVCNRPQASWPQQLRTLRALIVDSSTTSTSGTEIGAAGISPKGLIIAGALTTPEILLTNSVSQAAGGAWQIALNLATPSAARLGLSTASGATATNQAVLTSVFTSGGVGRIVRLRDHGMDQYGVVADATAGPSTAVITLAAAPDLVRLVRGGVTCGVHDLGEGMALSVVDLVRYDIRSMINDANYASLYKASGLSSGGTSGNALPYEGGRAELVRVELAPSGVEIDSTREIVGEYAVDLQVNAWSAANATDPTLTAVTANIDTSYSTQLLRGIHLRFAVRSREADRLGDVTGITRTNPADIYRIGLRSSSGGSSSVGTPFDTFARVRTFQSDIALRNLENSNW